MMSFRDFSFTVYTAPGVEEECLSLQDGYGVDVNMLLFCAYAAVVAGVVLSVQDLAEIDQEVTALRDGVIAPLRTCRRALKQGIARLPPEQAGAAQQLRTRVKDIELAAEYLEQDRLVAWLAASVRGAPDKPSTALGANIGLLLRGHARGDRNPPYPANLARVALCLA
ncbi:MAG: TIGR02444 family protein [Proteobacteria bacterium]|nr:TIGR02444 family protein [Pseudomonadota bacterium]